MKKICVFIFLLFILLFNACRSTKVLKDNEYMLYKNTVVVDDVKNNKNFDGLYYLIKPVTNTKSIGGLFNFKTSAYALGQPKIDKKNGELKDSKFKQWLRNSVGEAPVLLDSSLISYSQEQMLRFMKKRGYFNSTCDYTVKFLKRDIKKATVNYVVTANKPFYIREVKYNIDAPLIRKNIILDSANRLFKTGSQYNEQSFTEERNRLTNLIKNKGYYYFTQDFIVFEVDTFNSYKFLDKKGNPTVSITIIGNNANNTNEDSKSNLLYRYKYNNIYIYSNYNYTIESNVPTDTTLFLSSDKTDSTYYYFITPKTANGKIIKDFKYKTLVNTLFTKRGVYYSSENYNNTYNKLSDLNNFTMINIDYLENKNLRDSLLMSGLLNVRYRLTRSKLQTVGGTFTFRSDRTDLSFSYSNRNIFKGAERLNVNIYGGVVYINALKKGTNDTPVQQNSTSQVYGDIGGNVSIDFPRFLFLNNKKYLKSIKYNTSLSVGLNNSWQYNRFMVNASLIYNWSPNNIVSYSFTPVSISSIDTTNKTFRAITHYPETIKKRFFKEIIISCKYDFNVLIPLKNEKKSLRLSVALESSGLTLYSFNKLAGKINSNSDAWKILGYSYSDYEKSEFILRYVQNINNNNSFALRFNLGIAYSFDPDKEIPFDKSFYVGGANSMRGWGVRGLGPGSYNPLNQGNTDVYYNFERVGDIKLECNLEYRGTLYKIFKYGIFTDMGNIWLSHANTDMQGSTFKFNQFYKQIAINVGLGLRLDFNFFLIRFDYGLPVYNPSMPIAKGYWINKSWGNNIDGDKLQWFSGFQFAINHAF